jgi:hypothetical protein
MKSMIEIFVLDYPLSNGGGTMYVQWSLKNSIL